MIETHLSNGQEDLEKSTPVHFFSSWSTQNAYLWGVLAILENYDSDW